MLTHRADTDSGFQQNLELAQMTRVTAPASCSRGCCWPAIAVCTQFNTRSAIGKEHPGLQDFRKNMIDTDVYIAFYCAHLAFNIRSQH